jgi:hypothetical protein
MKNIDKLFTFGFELEGEFSENLYRKIQRKYGRKYDIDWKSDGSVDVQDLVDNHHSIDYTGHQEFTIGIFPSLDKMLKCLELFKSPDYLQNDTCGLHIHIKPKKYDWKLRAEIGDYKFLVKLQEFCKENLCDRIRRRLLGEGGETYAIGQEDFTDLYYDWRDGVKYRFCRNHPEYHTFEFRLFDTCSKKVENVQKFFQFFFSELEKQKPSVSENIILEDAKPKKIKENYILNYQKNRKLEGNLVKNIELCSKKISLALGGIAQER